MKLLRFGSLPLLVLASLAQAPKANPFEPEILKFEEADAKRMPEPGGIVFVGSSSIRRWDTLKADFPKYNVLNRGFGGSQVADSVYYAKRIVTKYKPKIVVFFAGTNDIADGKSAETVFDGYKAFVREVRADLPKVKMVFIAISPAPSRWAKVDVMRKANRLIEEFSKRDKGLRFLNTFPQMLDAKGGPRPELYVADQLHLKPAGYAIWVKALTPVLAELSGK